MQYETPEEVETPPEDGFLISGLFIDSANWDREEQALEPSLPGVRFTNLPLVLFLPVVNYVVPEDEYQMPVYRTSVRDGVLSTTGASTNYVNNISVPTKRDPNFFVLQGTAGLCALDD